MTWLSSNWGVVGSLTLTHLWIALPVIALSALFSVPIARWAAFSPRGGWVLSALSALYAVPSLPLLIVIPVIVGVALRSPANMVIVLKLYGVAVLVVATSTVSLVTVGAFIGVRSLGTLFTDGFQRGIIAEVVAGLVATVLLALVIDTLVQGIGWALTPWTRRGRA